MIRTLILLLASAIPLFAQSADDEKFRRPFGSPRPAGLLSPRPVDESTIDREATLRQVLPSEIASLQQEERLRATKQLMQGYWRVETFMIDGTVLRPGEFAGLKYLIRDNVIVQSQTATEWLRPVEYPSMPSQLQTAVDDAKRERKEADVVDSILRNVTENRKEWQLPAENPRPVGESLRNDPKDEEGMRLQMLHRATGQAYVYTWDRYGESGDPHNKLNRPSARVVLPAVGSVEVGEGRLLLAIRGVDLRALIPAGLRKPLGDERTLLIRMSRHDQEGKVQASAPTSNPSTGDLSTMLGLGNLSIQDHPASNDRGYGADAVSLAGRPARDVVHSEAQVESKWVVRPLAPVKLFDSTRRDTIVQEPARQEPGTLTSVPKVNLIPKMMPVALGNVR